MLKYWGIMCRLIAKLFTVSVFCSIIFGSSPILAAAQDVEGAASEPKAVAIAEPNLGALLGLGNPISTGNHAALLQGLGGHPLAQTGGGIQGSPNLQALRDSGALGNICNSNNGNSDALTNLLVYQYLSGSMPAGAQNGGHGAPNAPAGTNPQLQALLEGSRESKTKTSVTTTLTTRTVTMEPSTKFSTDTTSYVTTITSLTSSVLPIIFRGSKITTTITDKKTEVLTATEFHTSSSVLTPSIIQTLNVEVTLTETSTKGLNGHYTLAQVTPGASKIIEQPLSASNIDFDTQGLDLSSLDLATLDLAGIRGIGKSGDNSNVVKALTALLKQYDEPEEGPSGPRGRGRNRDRNRNRKENRFGNTRFHSRSRFSPEKDEPKFNVIRGFTLSDRPETRNSDSGNAGTALTNTRYSKFRKKNNPENNSLRASEPDRESERFSASTSRRTVSRANRNRDTTVQGRSRFQQRSAPDASSSPPRGRTNRQIERSRRRSGRNLRTQERANRPNVIRTERPKSDIKFRTTLLTMHISGIKPGEIITTTRTVTLRGLGSDRVKRHLDIKPTASLREPILNTEIPDLTPELGSEKVIRLLKELDQSSVRKMLHSLHDWVNYYLHQVLDETIEPSLFPKRLNEISSNDITELYSSKIEEESSSSRDPTAHLGSLPNAITGDPIMTSTEVNICPKVSVLTETVYQTISVTVPR